MASGAVLIDQGLLGKRRMHAEGGSQGKSYDPRQLADDAYTMSEHTTSIVLRPERVHGYGLAVASIGARG